MAPDRTLSFTSWLVAAAAGFWAACGEVAPIAPPLDGGDGGGDAAAQDGADAGDDAADADGGAGDAGDDAADADGGAGDAADDAGSLDGGPGDAAGDAGPRAYPWTPVPAGADPAWLNAPPECDPEDWLGKYFRYRLRLRGNGTGAFPGFVSRGEAAGESLMAGERIPDAGCDSHWWFVDSGCSNFNIANTKGLYGWGDGVIWHGWYLVHLAAEHAAFRALGLDLEQNREELYQALQAFNRLDRAAETNYKNQQGVPLEPKLDGFYQRDDVPPDFVWKNSVLRFPRADGFAGYGCTKSTGGCGSLSIQDGSYESQDQEIGLLLGLAMVVKLVPEDVQYNGIGLAQEAKAIADRTVRFLRDHAWKIVDPEGKMPPNEWGGSALPYSNQIAKAANLITGNVPPFLDDYRDTKSKTEGQAIWTGVDASWSVQTGINKSLALKLAAVADEWSPSKLARRAVEWGTPVHALINALLYDRPVDPAVAPWELESILTSAPCGGPCQKSPSTGCVETPGWMGANRWGSPDDRSGGHYLTGEYNGNDYLVLHDLVLLTRSGKYTVKAPPLKLCREGAPLDPLIASGPPAGATYDPWDPCAGYDLHRTYCGRSFAAWLDAAYHGQATIFVGEGRLECTGDRPCVVQAASGSGTDGADLFIGKETTDRFNGGAGDDCLYGNGGDDELIGARGIDEIHGGEGGDELCGESCSAGDLDGEPDLIFGEGGNDTIYAGPGNDEAFGGEGDDRIDGGGGPDFVYGEGGNDVLTGELGEDFMSGGPGNYELRGGLVADQLRGDEGRDKLDVDMGDDVLIGGTGDDFLQGGDGDDTLWGEDGNDRLCGGCGKDFLNGGWWSGDACRDKGPWYCLSDKAGTVEGCGTTVLSADDCNDQAFGKW